MNASEMLQSLWKFFSKIRANYFKYRYIFISREEKIGSFFYEASLQGFPVFCIVGREWLQGSIFALSEMNCRGHIRKSYTVLLKSNRLGISRKAWLGRSMVLP